MRKIVAFYIVVIIAAVSFTYADVNKKDGFLLADVNKADGFDLAGGAPPVGTCTLADNHTDVDNIYDYYVGRYNDSEYTGTLFTPDTDVIVCRVEWKVYNGGIIGNIDDKDYYTEIWNMAGAYPTSLTTKVTGATSSVVDGANLVSDQWTPEYNFSPGISLTAGTTYAIIHKMLDAGDPSTTAGKYDGSNFWHADHDNNNNGGKTTHGKVAWSSSTLNYNTAWDDTGDDPLIRIYTLQ